MATEPHQAPPKLSLVSTLSNRDESPNTFDERVVNGYVEKTEDGVHVYKRPAFVFNQTNLTYTTPLGIFNWNGTIYYIAGGFLVRLNGPAYGPIDTTAHQYSFVGLAVAPAKLVFHNQIKMYVFDGTTVTNSVAGSGLFTMPGLADLDATLYGGAVLNTIRGSGINDPTTWDPLNAIKAQLKFDQMVAIRKQLQYILAFKTDTTEVFWDAGNPTGSPLQAQPGSLIPFGCYSADTIQELDERLIWVGRTPSGSLCVLTLENLHIEVVSTPAIERLLQGKNWSSVYSWACRIGGHKFYCITLVNSNLSLVLDLATGFWSQWTYNGGYLPFVSAASDGAGKVWLQHENGKALFNLVDTAYQDNDPTGASSYSISWDAYTPNWDGKTRNRKVLKRAELIGDQVNSAAYVSWSDDDYRTWSTPRRVNLQNPRPFFDDCGTFYRRAFHIHHEANTALRMKYIELTNILEGAG